MNIAQNLTIIHNSKMSVERSNNQITFRGLGREFMFTFGNAGRVTVAEFCQKEKVAKSFTKKLSCLDDLEFFVNSYVAGN